MHTLTLTPDFRDTTMPERRRNDRAAGAAAIDAGSLDALIPLRGASHADVVGYTVEVPMRYAECLAILADGRKVALLDRRQFKGWTDSGSKRTLLFEKADLHLELQVDDGGSQSACKLRPIMAAAKMLNRCKEELRRFVQVDGDVFYLPSM